MQNLAASNLGSRDSELWPAVLAAKLSRGLSIHTPSVVDQMRVVKRINTLVSTPDAHSTVELEDANLLG